MARPEIAQLVQSGAQMGLGLMQEKRMGDLFKLEKDKFQEEKDAAGAIGEVYAGEKEFTSKRAGGAQMLGELRKLTAMDPAVRKSQAPVVFAALEESTGKPLAENFKQFVLSSKPEVAGPVLDKLLRGYANDPTQTLDQLQQLLSNPLASAQTIGQISRDLGDVASQEALTGPVSNPRRNKFLEQKAAYEREIAGLEGVMNKYGHTKAAQEVAQRRIDQLRDRMGKLENAMSSQEANAQGIPVRPGTTLTESGDGQLAVLQGPDDSGNGGGGAGGMKSSDETAIWRMLAPEFGDVIDLEKGIIDFAVPEDSSRLNDLVADVTRIYVNAGGRLTYSEAIREGKRKRSASPQGGGTGGTPDPNDPYAQWRR